LDAVDDDSAFVVLLEPVDAADHRGFARAGRAADHDALAEPDGQGDAVQRAEVAEGLAHPFEPYDWIGGTWHCSVSLLRQHFPVVIDQILTIIYGSTQVDCNPIVLYNNSGGDAMLRRNLILLAATVPVMLCAPALAQNLTNDLAASSALEEIKKRGTIRVGFSTFVPWAMRNTKGEFIGFEIDVARKLAEDNEWQLELVPTAWDGIIPALIAGKFDVIIGGMSVTPKRAQTVNF